MNRTKIAIGIASIGALGAVAFGGAAIAAQDNGANRSSISSSSGASGQANAAPDGAQNGLQGDQHGMPGGDHGMPGGDQQGQDHQGMAAPHDHQEVTGSALTKLTAAVKAEGYTLTEAMADPDGSYDVAATKDGSQVMLDVSKDLKTITERPAPPAGGQAPGGQAPGGQAPGGTQSGSQSGQPTISGSKA
ncbi:MAG: hypothetical protein V9F00_10730 [Nocardioides sp.]